jgi:O-antigen/teichoic acid export membrane protein
MRGGALVMAATLLWHASNFAYNSLGAHALGPSQYGALAAVVALLYVVSPLLFSVQTLASGVAARLTETGNWDRLAGLLRYYTRRLAVAAVVLTILLLPTSEAVARALHLPSALPVILVFATLPLAVVVNVQRGALQGSRRFGRYAGSTAVEAVAKVGVAVALILLWPTVEGALLAVLAGLICAGIAHFGLLRFLPRRPSPLGGVRHPTGESAATLASLSLLALLFSVDVIVAKHFMSAHDAGLYAAVSLCGKIVFFATSGLNWLLFPLFSAIHQRGGSGRQAFLAGLAVLLAVSAAIATVEFTVPSLVVTPLVGTRYAAATHYIGLMAIAFGLYGAVYLASLYLLSRKRIAGVAVLAVAAVAQLGGLAAFHRTVFDVAWVELVVFGAAAAVLAVVCLRIPLAQPSREGNGRVG